MLSAIGPIGPGAQRPAPSVANRRTREARRTRTHLCTEQAVGAPAAPIGHGDTSDQNAVTAERPPQGRNRSALWAPPSAEPGPRLGLKRRDLNPAFPPPGPT